MIWQKHQKENAQVANSLNLKGINSGYLLVLSSSKYSLLLAYIKILYRTPGNRVLNAPVTAPSPIHVHLLYQQMLIDYSNYFLKQAGERATRCKFKNYNSIYDSRFSLRDAWFKQVPSSLLRKKSLWGHVYLAKLHTGNWEFQCLKELCLFQNSLWLSVSTFLCPYDPFT